MNLLRENYRDLYDAMRQFGYEINHSLVTYEGESERRLDVTAMVDGHIIAKADFLHNSIEAHCNNITVDEPHRRRKIATTLYCVAEAVFCVALANFWREDPYQSAAARSLWASEHRPFGRGRVCFDSESGATHADDDELNGDVVPPN